jgi:hypothetical protein
MAVSRSQARQTPPIEIRTPEGIAVLFRLEAKAIDTNYDEAMKFLKSLGLLSVHQVLSGKYGENDATGRALALLDAKPQIKSFINENHVEYGWFHTGAIGIEKSGTYTFDENGKLTEGQGDIEKTVYIRKGNNPLSLLVYSDFFATSTHQRFSLIADDSIRYVAPMVVGFKPSQPKFQLSCVKKKSNGILWQKR